jgi:hypothetical protein
MSIDWIQVATIGGVIVSTLVTPFLIMWGLARQYFRLQGKGYGQASAQLIVLAAVSVGSQRLRTDGPAVLRQHLSHPGDDLVDSRGHRRPGVCHAGRSGGCAAQTPIFDDGELGRERWHSCIKRSARPSWSHLPARSHGRASNAGSS